MAKPRGPKPLTTAQVAAAAEKKRQARLARQRAERAKAALIAKQKAARARARANA